MKITENFLTLKIILKAPLTKVNFGRGIFFQFDNFELLRAKPYTFAKLHILHMENYMFCTRYILLHMQKHIQVVSEKIIQFSIFICGKSKQSTATTLRWLKHNCPVCKKIFKWYHSMVRCKSCGLLSDEC